MLRVYTASKLSMAPLWEKLHDEWPEVYFHARWLKHQTMQTPNTKENAAEFWIEDEEDVRNADVVLLYGKPEEKLRGALVEAGIAIALGIPVIVVGEHPDYSTWQYHPGVTRVGNLEEAKEVLGAIRRSQVRQSTAPRNWWRPAA